MKILRFFVIFWLVDVSSELAVDNCKDKEKCGDCIQTSNCGWCSAKEFKDPDGKQLDRCFSMDAEGERVGCEGEFLIHPTNHIQFTRDVDLVDGDIPVQLRPQHVKIGLSKNMAYNLSLSFRVAENYPLDLYYLMDLSHSMADDKETVAQLGSQLSAEMRKRTSNFRIGFGSFVDKVVMPFVSTAPHKLQNPCDEKEEENFKCAPPFSYRHTLSLQEDSQRFKNDVERAAVSGNLDAPEGGFDAIMQAIVCGEQIGNSFLFFFHESFEQWRLLDFQGWRTDARKLLMFSTDASFHFAGDGKLGGIIEPHDGICHLDEKGQYTHDRLLDYPSIAQINSKVKEKSIAILFAVTEDQLKDYERLSAQIQASSVGELSGNSSNVVELVNQEYDKFTSEVKLSHSLDEEESHIHISLFSHCGEQGSTTKEGGRCDGVKIGETVSFTVELLLTACPSDRQFWSKTFAIQVVGIEERLVVDLEFLCGCDCETPEHVTYETRAHACGLVGTLQCGACDCGSSGYYGSSCECSSTGLEGPTEITNATNSACRDENAYVDCSDRGECFCNQCDCRKLPTDPDNSYYGKYCQCDDFSCRRVNGLLCSGSDHGKCICSECKCDAGWMGTACHCSTSKAKCHGNNADVECSGKGHCECNRCVCDTPDYSGPLCEECQNCPDKCTDMAKCVLCTVHRNASGFLDCSADCLPYPEVNIVEFAPTSGGKYCSGIDPKDDCTYYYSYSYSEANELTIKAQKSKSCALLSGSGGWFLGGSIMLTILIIGLLVLLLVWCYRDRQARREYARFDEDKKAAKWDAAEENPLYRSPYSTFKNPLHESNQNQKAY